MWNSQLLSFVSFVAIITITPGQDMALLTQTVLLHGRQSAFWNIFGIFSAVWIHVCISVFGLSQIFHRYPKSLFVIQILGALFLFWLGSSGLYQLWKKSKQPVTPSSEVELSSLPKIPVLAQEKWYHFRRGFLSNLLNVKLIIFYLTILPSFVQKVGGTSVSYLQGGFILASIQVGMGLIWLFIFTCLLHQLRPYLLKPKIRLSLEVLTSLVMLGLGSKLLLALVF